MFWMPEILAAVPGAIVGVHSIIPDPSELAPTAAFIFRIVITALMLVFLVPATAWRVYKWLKPSEDSDGYETLFLVAITALLILVLLAEVGVAKAGFILLIAMWAFWFGMCGFLTVFGLYNWLKSREAVWALLFLVGMAVIYHPSYGWYITRRLTSGRRRILLRGRANRRVAYVTSGSQKTI